MTDLDETPIREIETLDVDAIIVGAGLAGLYATYKLRSMGLSVRGVENGSNVGGTWFWNRYPGCRCDIPTVEYSYSFDPDLEQEWSFPEMMSTQPEIEKYINHVADRHALRDEYVFDTTVTAAHFDESTGRWSIETDRGDHYTATYCVMATGALSAANYPDIRGLADFQGTLVHTSRWPADGVDLTGKRVGVIGTGSSGMQSIPQIARQAAELTVFQRTANYTAAGQITPTPDKFEKFIKRNYRELRRMQRTTKLGLSGMDVTDPDSPKISQGALLDLTIFSDPDINKQARDAFADSVRSRVDDPATAEKLIPVDYPYGCKRLTVEIGYFETFNEPHVHLVDLRENPITEITESAVRTDQGDHEVDVLVFATGFDALTGPLGRIDITGRDGLTLADKWKGGPSAYLGLVSAGFPNMFVLTGPGSPSVLANMVVAIEQHVDLTAEIIDHMRRSNYSIIDADVDAEDRWLDRVEDIASGTQYTDPTCKSWYLGSNIEGKPRRMLAYVGGLDGYIDDCRDVVDRNFAGFRFENAPGHQLSETAKA